MDFNAILGIAQSLFEAFGGILIVPIGILVFGALIRALVGAFTK